MPSALLADCIAASGNGDDFPRIWRNILRVHPLVEGAPIQVADDERVWLEISLTTGQRIAYHEAAGWHLLDRVAVAPRGRSND